LQQSVAARRFRCGAIFNDQFTVQSAGEKILKSGEFCNDTNLTIYFLDHPIYNTQREDPHQDIILICS